MVAPLGEHEFFFVVHLLELPGSGSPEPWQITSLWKPKVSATVDPEQLQRDPGLLNQSRESETRNSRKHDRKGTKDIICQNQDIKVGVIPIFRSSGSSNEQFRFRISTTPVSCICIKECSHVTWEDSCVGNLVSICVI